MEIIFYYAAERTGCICSVAVTDVMHNLTHFCEAQNNTVKRSWSERTETGEQNFSLAIYNCSQYQAFQNRVQKHTQNYLWKKYEDIHALMTALKALIQIRVGLSKGSMNQQLPLKGKTRQSFS